MPITITNLPKTPAGDSASQCLEALPIIGGRPGTSANNKLRDDALGVSVLFAQHLSADWLTDVSFEQKQLKGVLYYLLKYATPADLEQAADVEECLAKIFEDGSLFPEEWQQAAKTVRQRWEQGVAERWPEIDEQQAENGREDVTVKAVVVSPSKKHQKAAGKGKDKKKVHYRLPEDKLPEIFGKDGVMEKIVCKITSNGSRIWALDPREPKPLVNTHADGHLVVGQWFPNMQIAQAKGAHAWPQAGIYGGTRIGVYSLQITGSKDDYDDDLGETFWYSAPWEGKKDWPGALKKACDGKQVVRVLRAAGDENEPEWTKRAKGAGWRPKEGVRYDGLYKFTGVKQNAVHLKHGTYLQYELKREAGQTDMDLLKKIPSKEQVAIVKRLDEIKDDDVPGWRYYEHPDVVVEEE